MQNHSKHAGARTINPADIPEDVTPESINPLGNYAVQIQWQDGFNQVCTCIISLEETVTSILCCPDPVAGWL